MNINTNNYSVLEILNMLDRRELLVNQDYQRGSGLWPDGASSYFIDTILEGFPFPKIYMYEFLDRGARGIRREIVDGQQRIKTIQRFYNNEFALTGDTLYVGRRFNDLDQEKQEQFLSYPVSVDVIRNATKAEILQMFRRMNAYTLPLNEAEKRHSSFEGAFKWFVNRLADALNEFFVSFGVFTNRQIVRMADAELITSRLQVMGAHQLELTDAAGTVLADSISSGGGGGKTPSLYRWTIRTSQNGHATHLRYYSMLRVRSEAAFDFQDVPLP